MLSRARWREESSEPVEAAELKLRGPALLIDAPISAPKRTC